MKMMSFRNGDDLIQNESAIPSKHIFLYIKETQFAILYILSTWHELPFVKHIDSFSISRGEIYHL